MSPSPRIYTIGYSVTLHFSSLVLLTTFGQTSTQPEKSPRSERHLRGGLGNGGKSLCWVEGGCGSLLKPIATSRDHQFSCSLGKKCPPTRHINPATRLHPPSLLV